MDLCVPLLLGTVREGRHSEHVARFVHGRLQAKVPDSPFIDPRDLPIGNLVRREYEMESKPPGLQDFVDLVARADGFMVVTPEYNYGIPGTLKNVLDVTFKPWNRKPFAMVGCGGLSGGLRGLDQLRQVVAGLGAIAVPAHLPVHSVQKAFGEQGPTADREEWEKRVDRLVDELLWYARALKPAREALAKR